MYYTNKFLNFLIIAAASNMQMCLTCCIHPTDIRQVLPPEGKALLVVVNPVLHGVVDVQIVEVIIGKLLPCGLATIRGSQGFWGGVTFISKRKKFQNHSS